MRSPYERDQLLPRDGEPESVKAILVEHYERCSFCNSKLIFTHDLNLSFLQVIETPRCPGCGVSLDPKKFTLH